MDNYLIIKQDMSLPYELSLPIEQTDNKNIQIKSLEQKFLLLGEYINSRLYYIVEENNFDKLDENFQILFEEMKEVLQKEGKQGFACESVMVDGSFFKFDFNDLHNENNDLFEVFDGLEFNKQVFEKINNQIEKVGLRECAKELFKQENTLSFEIDRRKGVMVDVLKVDQGLNKGVENKDKEISPIKRRKKI